MNIELKTGTPIKDGWYLVKLVKGRKGDRPFYVDWCRKAARTEGGGREWVSYYPYNVASWAELPED